MANWNGKAEMQSIATDGSGKTWWWLEKIRKHNITLGLGSFDCSGSMKWCAIPKANGSPKSITQKLLPVRGVPQGGESGAVCYLFTSRRNNADDDTTGTTDSIASSSGTCSLVLSATRFRSAIVWLISDKILALEVLCAETGNSLSVTSCHDMGEDGGSSLSNSGLQSGQSAGSWPTAMIIARNCCLIAINDMPE